MEQGTKGFTDRTLLPWVPSRMGWAGLIGRLPVVQIIQTPKVRLRLKDAGRSPVSQKFREASVCPFLGNRKGLESQEAALRAPNQLFTE